jgi:SH3 domain protein
MRKLRPVLSMTLGFYLIVGASSWASTAYVTDSFEITLRTGPSTRNKIIGMPSSGQRLEVLETQGDWSRVRVLKPGAEDLEGWILSRYLITRLPWELEVKSSRDEKAALKERLARLERERGDATSREQTLIKRLAENSKSLQELRTEYESLERSAAGYLGLQATHEATKSALETSQKSLQSLMLENERLRSSQRNRWFITGALVLLGGWLIGLVMGRQEKKRRSSWYS